MSDATLATKPLATRDMVIGDFQKIFALNTFLLESAFYDHASSLSNDYQGGSWFVAQLPGGHEFPLFGSEQTFNCDSMGHQTEVQLNAEAFSIVVSLFFIDFCAARTEGDALEGLLELRSALMDYAYGTDTQPAHEQSREIFLMLD